MLSTMVFLATVSVGYAAPNTDFKKGDVYTNIEYRTNASMSANGDSVDVKSGVNDYSLTYGISEKFALQYSAFRPKSEDSWNRYHVWNYKENFEINSQEINLLYKINPNLDAFVGLSKVYPRLSGNGYVEETPINYSLKGFENNEVQIGLAYSKKLNEKFDTYALGSIGNNIYKWQVGLKYKFDRNLSFDVNYQENKFDNLGFRPTYVLHDDNHEMYITDTKIPMKVKSIGWGLNYKF